MINQLKNHITKQQIDEICEVMLRQYRSYVKLINSREYNQLFSNEYAPHNKQHSVSWAISSGFPSNTDLCGLHISKLDYGKGHTRPELENETIMLNILNKTTNFNAKYLTDKYQFNQNNFRNKKLYCFIKFEVKNKTLLKIELCLPDASGKIIESETLFTTQAIMLYVA